jgi:hypothetical protein
MSMKPKVILTEEVVAQMQELESKKNELDLKLADEQRKLEQIQQVMEENTILEVKAKAYINEFLSLQNSLWGKNKEYYPEIRFLIMQKTVELLGIASAEAAAAGAAEAPPADGTATEPPKT